MATFSMTVNGVERPVKARSLEIFKTLDGPGSLLGDFISEDGSLEVENDDPVILMLDSAVLFSGYVTNWRLRGAGGPAIAVTSTEITAMDDRAILKHRFCTVTIAAGQTLKQALTTLVAFAPEITLSVSQANGPTSTEDIVFTRARLNDAIGRVVLEIGAGVYTWHVNTASELRAATMGEIAAPFDLVEGDGIECGDVEVEDSRDDNYANRVFVDGGIVTQLGRTEQFVGDGVTDRFPLEYRPFNHRGYVTNGEAGGFPINETLGTSPATWEIDYDTNELVKVDGPPPTLGDDVIIVFDGTLHIQGEADGRGSPPAQERASYESVDGLTTTAQANAAAAAILAQKIASSKICKYSTRNFGLEPGQTQSITSAKRHISTSDWLVRQLRTVYDGASEGDGLLHTAELSVSGVVKGTFTQTYRQWAETGGAPEPPPAQVITSAPSTGGVVRQSAGGANKEVQFNDNGPFGGAEHLSYDKTTMQTRVGARNSNSAISLATYGAEAYQEMIWGGIASPSGLTPAKTAIALIYNDPDGHGTGEPLLVFELYRGLTANTDQSVPTSKTRLFLGGEVNGTYRNGVAFLDQNGTSGGGTGAVPGCSFAIQRNAAGSGAAATISLMDRSGTIYYLWVEGGKLRIGTTAPTEDNTTGSHTGGAVVGSQS